MNLVRLGRPPYSSRPAGTTSCLGYRHSGGDGRRSKLNKKFNRNKRDKRKDGKNSTDSSEGNRTVLTWISAGPHIGRKIGANIKNSKQSKSQRSMSCILTGRHRELADLLKGRRVALPAFKKLNGRVQSLVKLAAVTSYCTTEHRTSAVAVAEGFCDKISFAERVIWPLKGHQDSRKQLSRERGRCLCPSIWMHRRRKRKILGETWRLCKRNSRTRRRTTRGKRQLMQRGWLTGLPNSLIICKANKHLRRTAGAAVYGTNAKKKIYI